MILAVDVTYSDSEAIVGGVLFRDWPSEKSEAEFVISCRIQEHYIPGQFYLRELPCIKAMLEHVSQPVDFIIIDGFVCLGKERKPGLGKHLREMINNRAVVIGVAKRAYRDTPASTEVLRGRSRRPLYVTADGITEERAKFLIQTMHGKNRVPTLLKCADCLSRKRSCR